MPAVPAPLAAPPAPTDPPVRPALLETASREPPALPAQEAPTRLEEPTPVSPALELPSSSLRVLPAAPVPLAVLLVLTAPPARPAWPAVA